MQDKSIDLLIAVERELENARISHKKAKKAAQEIAASAALSPSQAGDRYHSQSTADISQKRYETVLALKKEIKQKKDDICYSLEGKEIFVVDNPILIPGLNIVSSKSALGQKLLGGDSG